MPDYEGRLELTWTNKSQCLLAHEDGSYQWVPPSDYRVAEVRLLHSIETVGEVHHERERAKDNLLIQGDALNALTSLIQLPEFAREYAGKVKLAYLDPPFNTQQSFLHYDDALEHSVWLTMMRDRLMQLRTLLAPDGSIYVHCDTSEGHYLKILLDEVFGRANFHNELIWKRSTAHSDTKQGRKEYGSIHDVLLFYSKGEQWTWNTQYTAHDEKYIRSHYTMVEPGTGRRYRLDNLTAPGGAAKGNPLYEVMGVTRYWRYSREKMQALIDEGRVVMPQAGEVPAYKRYLDETPGVPLQDLWTDINAVNSQAVEAEGYATQKPEALLERIIRTSSDEGDVVLDCFLGSGTTAAVAHKLGRRWLGVEWSRESVESFAKSRLRKVVEGQRTSGTTRQSSWQGGGGFRILQVAPSMFDAADGQVFLSDWATNAKLSEVTAAQLHYDFESDPPFCGRRGRSRLAVIDGLVNAAVVQLLVDALPEGERLVVCGTAVAPEARDVLKERLAGSSVRKIPQSILREYRQAARASRAALGAAPLPQPVIESPVGSPA